LRLLMFGRVLSDAVLPRMTVGPKLILTVFRLVRKGPHADQTIELSKICGQEVGQAR
jgi:hypothetical protein